ncbi:pyridoxamine 5'-phosphate oxidase [Paenibacillus sp. L3-i20]|nr:pyridoxamine 5'-phosphate oxidase [Paenibacillus sp. L3-i20]
MFTIRMKKRECTDQFKIDTFLAEAQTGYLGLADGVQPYVVPLNYVWLNNSIYFHGAEEGRKIDIIGNNNEACFTISEAYGTIPDPIPAKTDTAYMSVMAFGYIEAVEGMDEATEAMQAMLNKYVPGYYASPLAKSHMERYRSSLGSKTAVFKLIVREKTAKENV